MSIGDIKIKPIRRRFAADVLFLAVFALVSFLLLAESAAIDQVLHLTRTKDQYFIGPYLHYLEDPEKNLTISDVSSPQMSTLFVRHSEKLLNLGLNSYAYWILFSVALSMSLDSQEQWLLSFWWPRLILPGFIYPK